MKEVRKEYVALFKTTVFIYGGGSSSQYNCTAPMHSRKAAKELYYNRHGKNPSHTLVRVLEIKEVNNGVMY